MSKVPVSQEAYKVADDNIDADEELGEMIKEGYITRDDVAFFYFVELSLRDMLEERTRDAKAKQFERQRPTARKIYDPGPPLVDVSDIDGGGNSALYQYVADKLGLSPEEVKERHMGYLLKTVEWTNKKIDKRKSNLQ